MAKSDENQVLQIKRFTKKEDPLDELMKIVENESDEKKKLKMKLLIEQSKHLMFDHKMKEMELSIARKSISRGSSRQTPNRLKYDKIFAKHEIDQNDYLVKKNKRVLDEKLFYLKEYQISYGKISVFDLFNCDFIGHGGFGEVYKVTDDEGNFYAVKRIKLIGIEKYDRKAMNEVISHRYLEHDNIVNFYEYWIEMDNVFAIHINLFMEYCPENLTIWFSRKREINESILNSTNYSKYYSMIQQICSGVKYIHSNNIIHRDLNPTNILIDIYGVCKIADFGLSTFQATRKEKISYLNYTCGIGTMLYSAPEQFDRRDYDKKVDIYPLGLIIMQFFTDFNTDEDLIDGIFSLKNSNQFIKHIKLPKNRLLDIEEDMVLSMIQTEPNLRPEIEDIITLFQRSMQKRESTWEFENKFVDKIPCMERDIPSENNRLDWNNLITKSNIIDENDPHIRKWRRLLAVKLPYLAHFKISFDSCVIFEHFDKLELIGKGAFGEIFRVKNRKGNSCALKRIKLFEEKYEKRMQEVIIHKQLEHPNIIQFYDYFIGVDNIHSIWLNIFMEIGDDNLQEWFRRNGKDQIANELEDYTMRKLMIQQISQGLEYLHTNMIIHGNLIPASIILDERQVCKIASFGLARRANEVRYNQPLGMGINYAAPENIPLYTYNFDVDIYSFGLILFQFYGNFKSQVEFAFAIRKLQTERQLPGRYRLYKEIPLEVEKDMILSMTNQELRPNIREMMTNIMKANSDKFKQQE